MKIREIRAAGLKGATPQGGWSSEPQPEDCIHTLVVVFTDEGVTGVGSVFTNSDLVQAALAALEPLVDLTFDAFSVATNPVAKPRMSAMALCALLQQN